VITGQRGTSGSDAPVQYGDLNVGSPVKKRGFVLSQIPNLVITCNVLVPLCFPVIN
jgi:hypothetical protein